MLKEIYILRCRKETSTKIWPKLLIVLLLKLNRSLKQVSYLLKISMFLESMSIEFSSLTPILLILTSKYKN